MISSNERQQLRKIFFEAWAKHQSGQKLSELEAQILNIMLEHPEYQTVYDQPEKYLEQDYSSHNPFMHLSLHLALLEQVATNRPEGIQTIYFSLCNKLGSQHQAEHQMMDCLAESLWNRQNKPNFNEEDYIQMLQKLLL